MRVEFDPAKDVANRAKHGVSLSLAAELDWDAALVWIDRRFEYDEVRMIALAPKIDTLYYVACTTWRLQIEAKCEGSSASAAPTAVR